MLQSVARFMFHNIGNLCSVKKIADTLVLAGRKISVHTVDSYLASLCESFILYKVGRFDIQCKQYLKTGEKYYLVDMGLKEYLLGKKFTDVGHILENVVYLELLRRGYDVFIGKVGNTEIDFIATNEKGVEYYQVSATVLDENTLRREIEPLQKVKDNYPKYLLTFDEILHGANHDGILQLSVLEWLLD